MKRVFWLLVSAALATSVVFTAGCGGGGDDGIGGKVQAIGSVQSDYNAGKISTEEYYAQLAGLMQEIDAMADGPAELKTSLEDNVWGRDVSAVIRVAPAITAAAAANANSTKQSLGLTAQAEDYLEAMLGTQAYLTIKSFFATIISRLTYFPVSALDVTQPEIFTALFQADEYAQSYDRVFDNPNLLGTGKWTDAHNKIADNPYQARIKRLNYQGDPVPSGLRNLSTVPITQRQTQDDDEDEDQGPSSTTDPADLAGTINGKWNGSCGGGATKVSGNFRMTIDANGNITGSFWGDDSGSISGKINNFGEVDASGKGSAGNATWSGQLSRTSNGELRGNGGWDGPGFFGESCSGGWDGSGI